MISLDTNILARFLLKDDAAQFKRAKELLASNADYTAPTTVILELVWVLESSGFSGAEILAALQALFGLPNFKPKEFEAVSRALVWYAGGVDFADALHLALSEGDDSFATFDKALGKAADKLGATPAVRVLRR